jgi:hypothetical protein
LTKDEFEELFTRSARAAIADAETRLGRSLPTEFDVELHGAGVSGEMASRERAVDLMYINNDTFYRLIDIAVKAIHRDRPLLFARISSHPPSTFDKTWNTPKGNGPFKVLTSNQIPITD